MRSIDAHCAQAITLHSYAPGHRSMAVKESPIGTRLSTSVQSKMIGNLIIDGEAAAHARPDFPVLGSQGPAEAPQPQCAAAAMMHGSSMGASSSWQGGCPPIAEHQEWYPPVPQQHVIFPNPGYKIEANIWHLDVKESARRPGPIASFLRHCNTMDSPYIPNYVSGGPQPADDIVYLDRNASMENLREP